MKCEERVYRWGLDFRSPTPCGNRAKFTAIDEWSGEPKHLCGTHANQARRYGLTVIEGTLVRPEGG